MFINLTEGSGFMAGGSTDITKAFLSNNSSNTPNTTYTFSSQSLGTPDPARYIILGYVGNSSTRTVTAASSTIGGVTVTKPIEVQDGNRTYGMLIANVPTGSTGTIAITWSGLQDRMGLLWWAAYQLTSVTPTDTATDVVFTGSDLSGVLDINTGGVGFGFVATTGTNSNTWSWANLDEDIDTNWATASREMSGASSLSPGSLTRTATITGTAGSSGLVLGAWA